MTRKQKRITITEVAKAAGVSKTTVSRYLNGHCEQMGEKTRERIREVIELLDYRPSDIARSLKSRKSRMIGVLISDITSPFFSAVIDGIGSVLTEADYVPVFVNCENDIRKEQNYIESFLARDVDGLIVNTSSRENPGLIRLAVDGVPIVLCDREVDQYDFDLAGAENEILVAQAIRHLKDAGYTRVGLFTQDYRKNSVRSQRRDSYLKTMQECFAQDATEDVYVVSDDEENQSLQLKRFMDSVNPGEKPAVFCSNSMVTIRMYRATKRLNIRIPEELGLAGTDDWDWENGMSWIDLCDTGITTVTFSPKKVGQECARLMLEKLDSPRSSPGKVHVPSVLNVRESTQPKR